MTRQPLHVLTFQPRREDNPQKEAARILRLLTPRRQRIALHLLRLSLAGQHRESERDRQPDPKPPA